MQKRGSGLVPEKPTKTSDPLLMMVQLPEMYFGHLVILLNKMASFK